MNFLGYFREEIKPRLDSRWNPRPNSRQPGTLAASVVITNPRPNPSLNSTVESEVEYKVKSKVGRPSVI